MRFWNATNVVTYIIKFKVLTLTLIAKLNGIISNKNIVFKFENFN